MMRGEPRDAVLCRLWGNEARLPGGLTRRRSNSQLLQQCLPREYFMAARDELGPMREQKSASAAVPPQANASAH